MTTQPSISRNRAAEFPSATRTAFEVLPISRRQLTSALLLVILLSACALPALAQIYVPFPDPTLEAAVRDAIGKPSGLIFDTDLKALKGLSARGAGITDLNGIQYCTSLTQLNLSNNEITNINYLFQLTSLTNLNFQNNKIIRIHALSGLTNLTMLQLQNNRIGNVEALRNMTSLTWLSLYGNGEITNINALSGLRSLTSLQLHDNHIVDISALWGLSNLKTFHIPNNKIVDISVLAGLRSLENLGLSGNEIHDISSLEGLTSLERLYLGDNEITDISALVANSGIAAGDKVDMRNNPLDETSVCIEIPLLEDSGVDVIFRDLNNIECPEPSAALLQLAGLTALVAIQRRDRTPPSSTSRRSPASTSRGSR
jgi:hypothetical protein